MKKIFLFLILPLFPAGLWAHGTSNIEGNISFSHTQARSGDSVQLVLTLRELEPNVMQGLRVFARAGLSFDNRQVEMVRTSYTTFTLALLLQQGRYSVRVFLVRDGLTEIGMNGFVVNEQGIQLTARDSELWFVPKGKAEPIPWLEHFSGFAVAIGSLWLMFFLYRNKSVQYADKKKPVWILLLATLASLSMPFGAYWDIAFHNVSGRESFFQAPHVLIYSGILTTLTLTLISIGGKSKGISWKAHAQQDKFVWFAAIALLIQLSSAPFDEIWHTVFGLDVSVWSPPHVVLIFGGVAVCIFLSGMSVTGDNKSLSFIRMFTLAGALLIAEVFLAEYEFPTPAWHISQFRPA